MSNEKRGHQFGGFSPFVLVVLFLFGCAVGYIVRDVRADRQVVRAAAETRDAVKETALEVIRRAGSAGGDFSAGLRVAVDSSKAALNELTGAGEDGDEPEAQEPSRSGGSQESQGTQPSETQQVPDSTGA